MAEAVEIKTNVAPQPVFRLVALFEESIEYDRLWRLPFHSLFLCVRDDPADASWVELPETGERFPHVPGQVYFTAALTPMRIRYTTANRHLCIHFRYELFPGVDVFSGLYGRFCLGECGGPLAEKIKAACCSIIDGVFSPDDNPVNPVNPVGKPHPAWSPQP